jgi:large subunit ribosomal protein L23
MSQERLLKVIISPHISEKATTGAEHKNEYVFRVAEFATKSEVKDAVEHLFNTKVKSVNVMKVRTKTKLFRGIKGQRKAWKKAYVTLQADQKLELLGAQ